MWQLITHNEKCWEIADTAAPAKKKRKLERSKAKKVYNLPRTRKLRVYPNQIERDTLKQWFGAVRRAYNKAVGVHKAVEKQQGELYERVKSLALKLKRMEDGRPIIKANEAGIYHQTRG